MGERINAKDLLDNGHLIKHTRRWKDKLKMGFGGICCRSGSGLCQMAVFNHMVPLLEC
jgi:hypothetical protein